MLQITFSQLTRLRTESSDTRNKFNKFDEQQQNRAHISSFHRVNSFNHTRQLQKTLMRFFFSSQIAKLEREKKDEYVAGQTFALEKRMFYSIDRKSEFSHEHFCRFKCGNFFFNRPNFFSFFLSCHFALFLFKRWFRLYLHSYSPPIKDQFLCSFLLLQLLRLGHIHIRNARRLRHGKQEREREQWILNENALISLCGSGIVAFSKCHVTVWASKQ